MNFKEKKALRDMISENIDSLVDDYSQNALLFISLFKNTDDGGFDASCYIAGDSRPLFTVLVDTFNQDHKLRDIVAEAISRSFEESKADSLQQSINQLKKKYQA